jgi:hypothetical protein
MAGGQELINHTAVDRADDSVRGADLLVDVERDVARIERELLVRESLERSRYDRNKTGTRFPTRIATAHVDGVVGKD